MEIKKGYHYTSYKNWENIQKEGFIPYVINKPEIDEHFEDIQRGTWTWLERPQGLSELGSILFQTATKQSTHIVLLEFDYVESDTLKTVEGRRIVLFHDGIMGDWMYHTRQPAVIVTRLIPPASIRLVKEVNLLDLVPPELGVAVNDATVLDEKIS